MRRRQFLAALGGMAAGPLASYAQGPGLPLIGYLGPEAPERFASRVNAFRDGLAETDTSRGATCLSSFDGQTGTTKSCLRSRPIWLLVAVTKTDLLHPDMAADIVANYYSAGGHSPFADELRLLRRKVGEGRLTTSTMPVYAVAEDFTYRGETLPTRGTDGDRDARLEEFRTRLRHLTGQIT